MAEDIEREKHIQARAEAGEYHCREHWIFDADADVLFLCAALAQARQEIGRLRNLPNLRLKFSLEKRGWKWHAPFWSKPGYCADAEGAACFQMAQSEQEQRERDAEVLEKWAETLENTMVRRALLDGASIIRAQSEG